MPGEDRRRSRRVTEDRRDRRRSRRGEEEEETWRRPSSPSPVSGRRRRRGGDERYERSYARNLITHVNFSKSRIAMLFPVPRNVASIEGDIEAKARDWTIDLGQSPPQHFKYMEVSRSVWDTVSNAVRSRNWPPFAELNVEEDVVKICLASFTSREGASAFVYERQTIEVPSLTDPSQSTTLSLHLLEAAPCDLYPLVRVIAHPAFLDFTFEPNELLNVSCLKRRELLKTQKKAPLWMAAQPLTIFIHTRRAEDRPATQICHVPLTWTCHICNSVLGLHETHRGCTTCGSVRTVLNSLEVDLTNAPTEVLPYMQRPCPPLRNFVPFNNSSILHSHVDDIYLLRDEATVRDSYAFFTRTGLFYTLNITDNNLILTHVLSVDENPPPASVSLAASVFPKISPSDAKENAEDQQRQANASLVASVLAQAQRAASMAAPRAAPMAQPVEKAAVFEEKPEAPPVFKATLRLSLPKANLFVPPPTIVAPQWKSSEEQTDEQIDTQKTRAILKGAPPPLQAVAEIRNPESRAQEREIEKEIETPLADLICFVCLRQFQQIEQLAHHNLTSQLHQENLRMVTEHKQRLNKASYCD